MRLPFFRRKQPTPQLELPPSREDAAQRLDSWVNTATGLGMRESRSVCTSFVGRRSRSDGELDDIYEFSRLAARIVDLEPDTALAKYFKVTELDDGQQVELEHYLLRLDAYAKIREAHANSRLYGGAVILIRVIDGVNDLLEPLNMSSIASLSSLQVFAGDEVSVASWNCEPASINFGNPETYRISAHGASFDVHYTRVLHFDGTKATRKSKRSSGHRGFSRSVIDQVWDSFQGYGTTRAYLEEATSRISQGVLKLGGFNDGMKGDSSGRLANKLKMLLKSMSTMGDVVVDKDGDDYTIASRSLTGFQEAAGVQVDALVAETGIPRSILMQQQQAGLSAGDNSGDWKSWSGHISSVQTMYLEPKIKRLLSVVFAARSSPIDIYGEYTITWHPVQEMTESERATIGLQRAQMRESDIRAGIVSTFEARQTEDVIDTYHIDDSSVEDQYAAPDDIAS